MVEETNYIVTPTESASFRLVQVWDDEPGQWYIQLGSRVFTLENVDEGTSQLEYMEEFFSPEETIENVADGWSKIGTKDDVIRRCLEYTGYNSTDRERDLLVVNNLRELASTNWESLAVFRANMPADYPASFNYLGPDSERYRNKILNDAQRREDIVKVYDRMTLGESIGLGWSNETLLANFPDSQKAQLVSRYLHGADNQRTTN